MTLIPSGGLTGVLCFLNLGDHLLKSVGNINIEPGTGFGEAAFEIFGHVPSLFCRDLPLLRLEISLIPDNHHWNPVRTQVVQNLLMQHTDHLEGLS